MEYGYTVGIAFVDGIFGDDTIYASLEEAEKVINESIYSIDVYCINYVENEDGLITVLRRIKEPKHFCFTDDPNSYKNPKYLRQ